MTATMTAQLADGTERAGLSARLTALAELIQIGAGRTGPDGFRDDLLTAAGDLLTQSGRAAHAVRAPYRRIARRRHWQRKVIAVQPAVRAPTSRPWA